MSVIDNLYFPGRSIPDANEEIVTSSNDRIAVRQPGDGLNPLLGVGIAVVDDIMSCIGIPCLYLAIVISHNNACLIGRPCYGQGSALSIIGVDGTAKVRTIVWMRHLPVRLEIDELWQETASCR